MPRLHEYLEMVEPFQLETMQVAGGGGCGKASLSEGENLQNTYSHTDPHTR